VDIADVDVLISVRSRVDSFLELETPLPARLGAYNALLLTLVGPCTIALVALKTALSLFVDPAIRRVLIVYSETFPHEHRSPEPVTEKYIPTLLSDGAAAALVERGAPLRALGFGTATDSTKWQTAREIEMGDRRNANSGRRPLREGLELMRDLVKLTRTAFSRCVAATGTPFCKSDGVVFDAELPATHRFVISQLGLEPTAYIEYEDRSHTWGADPLIALSDLEARTPLSEGGRLFVGCFAIGESAFGAFETTQLSTG
jgi:3-oxoacyl-[acyl-carrier-protein] synthase III